MVRANAGDKVLIVRLLSQAFEKNKSVNFIIKDDKNRQKRITALMEYSFDVCFMFGEIYLSNDRNATALLLPSNSKKTTPYSIWIDIKLIFRVIGIERIIRVLKREASIKKVQLKNDHFYLWFIGVDTDFQHRGIGTQFLIEILNYSKFKGIPLCLETSTPNNISWYQKLGFEIYNMVDLGYMLYFLKTN